MSNQEPERRSGAPDAESLAAQASHAAGGGRPPLHLWNPPYCGELDIRILRDGLWLYLGTPIGREPLVRLFASILRREADDRYYLVTPVEKVGIQVEDAPFVAVDFRVEPNRDLTFVTNVGDETTAGPERPIRTRFDADDGEPAPYVLVRDRLEARIDRKSFYRLADLGRVEARPEGSVFGVRSGGAFFALARPGDVAADDPIGG